MKWEPVTFTYRKGSEKSVKQANVFNRPLKRLLICMHKISSHTVCKLQIKTNCCYGRWNHDWSLIFYYLHEISKYMFKVVSHDVNFHGNILGTWFLNNRNFKLFLTNTNVTSRSLNTSWSIFHWANTFVKRYRKCTIIHNKCLTCPNLEFIKTHLLLLNQ